VISSLCPGKRDARDTLKPLESPVPKYKNQFKEQTYYDHTIVGSDGKKVGTLRIKPSSVLWKPKSQQQFYSVPLEEFAEWITSNASAKKTGS
jgi:hypothetical protein